ncbi:MAG: ATP phosphoribosyltransferase regulatory subunit [Parvibaculales bacterium]
MTLKTTSEIIDALGGTQALAKRLGVGPSAISNYRKNGFPAAKHYALAKACQAQGLQVDEAIFGTTSYQPKSSQAGKAARHFRYELTVTPEADSLLAGFSAQGFEPVEFPILQPSAPFINRMGAEMQRRLYRFTDPGGEELCLRPDLTIPTALKYIETQATGMKRYCYQGTAFRYQPRGAGKPEEFTQAGIEIIGGADGEKAIEDDVAVLSQILGALKTAGLREMTLTLRDITQMARKVSQLEMPPDLSGLLLQILNRTQSIEGLRQNVTRLLAEAENDNKTEQPIAPANDRLIAGRQGRDILARLEMKIRAREIMITNRERIQQFLDSEISQIFETDEDSLAAMTPLQQAALEQDIPSDNIEIENMSGLSAHQKMAYYTGLSFDIRVPALGPRHIIASGGRYDDLLQNLGAGSGVPAVGGAIALERLHEALTLESA